MLGAWVLDQWQRASVSTRHHSINLSAQPARPVGDRRGRKRSYGILAHDAGEDILVALFKIPKALGIFYGDLHPDRQSA